MNAAEAAPSGDKQKDNPIAGAIEASTPAGDAVADWGILEQAAEASTADSGSKAPVNWESLGNLEYSSSETRKCSDITPEEIARQIEWIKGQYAKAKENDPDVSIGACITSLASMTGSHFNFAGYHLGDKRPRREEDEQWLRELCEGAIIESIREQTAAEASTADSGSKAPVNWESLGNLEYSSSETRKCSDITPEEIERQIEWIKGEYAKAKENNPDVPIGNYITSLTSATGSHFKFAGYQFGDRRPRRQEDEQWLRELCERAISESIRERTTAEASTADSGSEEDGAAPMAFAEQVAGAIDAEPAKAEPAKVGPAKDEKNNKRGGWFFGLFRRNK